MLFIGYGVWARRHVWAHLSTTPRTKWCKPCSAHTCSCWQQAGGNMQGKRRSLGCSVVSHGDAYAKHLVTSDNALLGDSMAAARRRTVGHPLESVHRRHARCDESVRACLHPSRRSKRLQMPAYRCRSSRCTPSNVSFAASPSARVIKRVMIRTLSAWSRARA